MHQAQGDSHRQWDSRMERVKMTLSADELSFWRNSHELKYCGCQLASRPLWTTHDHLNVCWLLLSVSSSEHLWQLFLGSHPFLLSRPVLLPHPTVLWLPSSREQCYSCDSWEYSESILLPLARATSLLPCYIYWTKFPLCGKLLEKLSHKAEILMSWRDDSPAKEPAPRTRVWIDSTQVNSR